MISIIAEVGCNHLGCMELAKRHIEEASAAGADIVKFQAYVTEQINDRTLHKFLRKAWLSSKQHRRLRGICEQNNVEYLCSPFDIVSAKMLKTIGMKMVKVPSGLMHDREYMAYVRDNFALSHISTGMATEKEIKKTLQFMKKSQKHQAIPMHCVSSYPCHAFNVNLYSTSIYGDALWGFSDHTLHFTPAMLAAARGALAIEHHFQVGNTHTPDTPVSFQPAEFKAYCEHIRWAETILGEPEKRIYDCEKLMVHRRKDKKS